MRTDDDDRECFTLLYRRCYAQVLGYVLRRVPRDRAPDVVAETFTAAWRELPNLPAEPLPWLYRAAALRISNEHRTTNRQARLAVRLTGLAAPVGPDHAAALVESAPLREALRQLPYTDREALLLVCWEDLDHASAAYVLGCSVPALKVRLHRSRKRLSRLLSRPEDTESASNDVAPTVIGLD